jgi:type II secretory pathway predicted ATPase ExeA
MTPSFYEKPKDVFLDVVNVKDYIQLDRSSTIYQTLKTSVQKPLKMILVFGKPGTGKSMMLNKLAKDLSKEESVFLYSTPIIDETEFLMTLAGDLYRHDQNNELNFTQFMNIAKSNMTDEQVPIVLLDEAQLYSPSLMEKIRLLSDSRIIKFVITLHKTEKEDLIAKEHFQTRIWESVELQNATASELKIYIQKKLMKANNFELANMFDDKNARLIHSFTDGNYRDTNKLLYTLFSIYTWYEENQPSKINYTKISNKVIEMAAIHTGLANA